MINLELDANNDIFTRDGTLALVTDANEVSQHIKTRLQFFFGEWFLDINDGVPWFQSIFTQPADAIEIESILKQTILSTDGVNEMLEFDMTFENTTRIFTVNFRCNTIYGDSGLEEVNLNV